MPATELERHVARLAVAAGRSRLHPGRNGLTREQVTDIQRGRIAAATVEAVDELGYPRLSVGAIISRARVSRKTFYDVFIDREDCFLAVFEATYAHARSVLEEGRGQEADWCEEIRSALARLLVLMDEEPALARLWFVEALRAGDTVLASRRRALAEVARVIDRGRFAANAGEPPRMAAESVVGGVFSVLHARLLDEPERELADLLGSLMYMIVLPYLGSSAANRELNRPAPTTTSAKKPGRSARSRDPLEDLDFRLTYRTVRVLVAIGDRPLLSNREIADRSGISDQGQISKLLYRLAGLELIENRGVGHEKGAANAWRLTRRGVEVVRATRQRESLITPTA